MTTSPALPSIGPSSRCKFWVGVVWVILTVKSIILTIGIMNYDAPVELAWIWVPSILAATVFTIILLRHRDPAPDVDD